jgi:uncharacterized protein YqeY
MKLAEQLINDMKQAMKDGEKFRLSTIRLIRAAIKNQEIELRRELDDNEVIQVLSRELKQRRDSHQDFARAGRDDLVANVVGEIEIITKYLPEQLNEEDIKVIVAQTMQETGASSKADLGKLMSALMPKVKGRADGKLVNQIVQQALQ